MIASHRTPVNEALASGVGRNGAFRGPWPQNGP
jgi:hypothetical protein